MALDIKLFAPVAVVQALLQQAILGALLKGQLILTTLS